MKKISALFAVLLVNTCLAAPASFAQTDNGDTGARMDKLEHDIMLLQRQIARGGAAAASSADSNAAPDPQAQVRLSEIDEEIRQLRGKLEESEFQNRKLSESLDKLQRDTDFRFNELSKNAAATAAATPAPADAKKPDDKPAAKDDVKADTSGKTTAGDGVLKADDDNTNDVESGFASPRDHYNYAFRLLNQTQYDKAAASFASFTKKYPKDPLVGNAYYWMGETYYIRRDYVNAADSFRQGFEALPSGPKAADNLLKLAMSLDVLNRDKEACVVLGQVVTKFKKTSTAVTEKAQAEQKRIECK